MALSRLTKGVVGGFFTRNTRIAFGHGCDRPNYVSAEYNFIQAICNGNRTNSVDRASRITTYSYDALNRLTNTAYADNTTSTTIYDGVGRVAQTIDTRETITGFSYDAAGRRLAITNALGTSVVVTNFYGYDANGNQTTFTDGLGHTTTNFYDALNRQTNVTFADGTKQITVYDTVGRRIAQTDQATNTTGFGYDGAGRLTSVTNALNQVTRYQYDEAGNQTAQIDALNRTNVYIYDGFGRRIQHLMPGGQSEGFGYDLAGNLICYTNFNGAVITNLYDLLNRLTARVYPNGTSNTFTYTLTGQRQTMTDSSGNYSYVYDLRDRLCTNSTPQGTLYYAYDANGNETNITSSTTGGTLVRYQYDALNRLTNVVDARLTGTQNTAYGFDNVGNLQRIQYPNSVTNLYQYDSLNRMTNLVWKTNGTIIASFAYTVGPSGNRAVLLETNHGVNRGYAWSYDPSYQLTNETVTGTAPTGAIGYGYDPVGNRTNRTGALGPLGAQTLAYNTNDWLAGDVYDSNGNTRTNASSQPFFYDYENRLTNFNNGTVIIVYDADGNRVKKVGGGKTTLYLVDTRNPSGYAQVLEELTATGTTNFYTYGLDLISQRTPGSSSSTNFFTYDGHGSTRMLTDKGGKFVNAFAYDAYGTLIASNSTPQTAYLYCGEQFDTDLGFYSLRARYLNPNTGRFWTMDTYAGNNEDSLSLHKYLYCQGNPVNGIDPSGQNVYVVTRPLDIPGMRAMGMIAVHVFLAFDMEGLSDTRAWLEHVIDLNKKENIPEGVEPGIGEYNSQGPVWTFSFHPDSVRSGDNSLNTASVISTKGSYMAYNATIDRDAFGKNGTGYWKKAVAGGQEMQMRLYDDAVHSRNINNSAPQKTDPASYGFTKFNCASWGKYVLGREGIPFPDNKINLGIGLGSGLTYTGIPYLITGIASGFHPSLVSGEGIHVNVLDYQF